jgi:hypothetical protein
VPLGVEPDQLLHVGGKLLALHVQGDVQAL